MGMIESRRRLMMAQGGTPSDPTIGGIPVWIDNAYYPKSNGTINSVTENNDFFIAGPFDTGTTFAKIIVLTRFGSTTEATMRMFNDPGNVSANSVDYWTVMRSDILPDIPTPANIDTAGRYALVSILKKNAADFYIKDDDGNYIVKGNNVT